MGTLTAGGLKLDWSDDKLSIKKEGKIKKFKNLVGEKTFAGASVAGRTILFITERAVFQIRDGSNGAQLELIEVAPGLDVERDIIAQMEFRPVYDPRAVKVMEKRLFQL